MIDYNVYAMLKCVLCRLTSSSKFPMTFSRAFSGTACLYSHYETLKIKPAATVKEIKEAYFKLSKQYHPDLHPNDPNCHDRFIRLQEAYKVLSNSEARKQYDSSISLRTGHSKYNNQRPYGYPDFTERDEWIKSEHARRASQFRREFKNNQTSYSEFNRFYSHPHNLTPEEMERFYKYRKLTKNNRIVWFIAGLFFSVTLIEALFVRKKDRYKFGDPYAGHDIFEFARKSNQQLSYEYEQQKRFRDSQYQDYLERKNFASRDNTDEKEL